MTQWRMKLSIYFIIEVGTKFVKYTRTNYCKMDYFTAIFHYFG